MALYKGAFRVFNRVFQTRVAYAHCDIPCGIYDPHTAQLAALTVVRMNQLIQNLAKPEPTSTPAQVEAYSTALSRFVAVKEQHAEACKHELRVLWGDYFRPEHIQQYPDLHDRFFNAMKLASKAKQTNDMDAAQQLLAAVQGIAEIFWKTKGAKVNRQPSRQTVGGELVYPA